MPPVDPRAVDRHVRHLRHTEYDDTATTARTRARTFRPAPMVGDTRRSRSSARPAAAGPAPLALANRRRGPKRHLHRGTLNIRVAQGGVTVVLQVKVTARPARAVRARRRAGGSFVSDRSRRPTWKPLSRSAQCIVRAICGSSSSEIDRIADIVQASRRSRMMASTQTKAGPARPRQARRSVRRLARPRYRHSTTTGSGSRGGYPPRRISMRRSIARSRHTSDIGSQLTCCGRSMPRRI